MDGIEYSKISDDEYYDQKRIEEEPYGYLSKHMIESRKSVFECTLCDSDVEAGLATDFENSDNISLYTKLPGWFEVPTPLGPYNPDWAILYNKNDNEKLFFVTESKGTIFSEQLRPIEQGKITCGKEHFKALSSRLILAHTIDDIHNQV